MSENTTNATQGDKFARIKSMLTKKNIIITSCAVVAIVLVIVLCVTLIGGSLSSILIKVDKADDMCYVTELSQLYGMNLTDSMVDERYGVFSDYDDDESAYVYGVYDFATSSFVVEPAVDTIEVINSTYGYFVVISMVDTDDGEVEEMTLMDVHGTEHLTFIDKYSWGYSQYTGFLSVDGENVLFVSPDNGDIIEIDNSYMGMQLTTSYDYYTGDEYVVLDSSDDVLYVYSAKTLYLTNTVDLSQYDASRSSYSLFLLANGNIFMQVRTTLDMLATKYDVLDGSQNKYNYDGYIINVNNGNISSKSVNYVVSSISNALTEDTADYMKSSVNIAEVSMIKDKQIQSSSTVFMGSDMSIDYDMNDFFAGVDSIVRVDGGYIGIIGSDICIFSNSGNMTAYDVDLLSYSMFVKNDNVYDISGKLVRAMQDTQTVVGVVGDSVMWFQLEDDDTSIVYYLDDVEIARDVTLTIVGDTYITIESASDGTYEYTWCENYSTSVEIDIQNSLVDIDIEASNSQYIIVSIGQQYFRVSTSK